MKYAIYEGNFEKFDKEMKRLVKKASKYSQCTVKYDVLGEHFELVDNGFGHKIAIKYIDVDVEGTVINNGWKYIATLEHIVGVKRNIIRQADFSVDVPERFYTCKAECEHCHQNRRRKDTYIVYNEEEGEFRQVGSACLQEYTNGLSAEAVANVNQLMKTAENGREYDLTDHTHYGDLATILKIAEPLVNKFGYEANEHSKETIDAVMKVYEYYEYGYKNAFTENLIEKGYTPVTANGNYIADALEWIEDMDPKCVYYNNIKAVCTPDYVNMDRDLGLAISIFEAYEIHLDSIRKSSQRILDKIAREEAEEQRRIEMEKKAYVGEVGEKISFEATKMIMMKEFETMFGTKRIYKFYDKENHIYVWNTGVEIKGFEEDKVLRIDGYIKAHNLYKDKEYQNELTKCYYHISK